MALAGSDGYWIDGFLDAIKAERGAAENTVAAYRRDLVDFAGWAGGLGGLASASRTDIEAYLATLDSEGLSPRTRARRLAAIRQFYRFAFAEGWRTDDPGAGIDGPRKARSLPRTLSIDQIDSLLDQASRAPGLASGKGIAKAVRMRCLVEVLYATGLRVTELVSLPVGAVRGDPRMILVRGKGDKERMVPLSEPAREALSEWLAVRDGEERETVEAGGRGSPFLFPSRGKSGHLTRIAFFNALKDLAASAGIDPTTVSPHTVRHAFASHLLQNGADLRAIQTLLGHSDIATTEIYTHVLTERLKTLVLEKHPLSEG